jgi:hypothetical protein
MKRSVQLGRDGHDKRSSIFRLCLYPHACVLLLMSLNPGFASSLTSS